MQKNYWQNYKISQNFFGEERVIFNGRNLSHFPKGGEVVTGPRKVPGSQNEKVQKVQKQNQQKQQLNTSNKNLDKRTQEIFSSHGKEWTKQASRSWEGFEEFFHGGEDIIFNTDKREYLDWRNDQIGISRVSGSPLTYKPKEWGGKPRNSLGNSAQQNAGGNTAHNQMKAQWKKLKATFDAQYAKEKNPEKRKQLLNAFKKNEQQLKNKYNKNQQKRRPNQGRRPTNNARRQKFSNLEKDTRFLEYSSLPESRDRANNGAPAAPKPDTSGATERYYDSEYSKIESSGEEAPEKETHLAKFAKALAKKLTKKIKTQDDFNEKNIQNEIKIFNESVSEGRPDLKIITPEIKMKESENSFETTLTLKDSASGEKKTYIFTRSDQGNITARVKSEEEKNSIKESEKSEGKDKKKESKEDKEK